MAAVAEVWCGSQPDKSVAPSSRLLVIKSDPSIPPNDLSERRAAEHVRRRLSTHAFPAGNRVCDEHPKRAERQGYSAYLRDSAAREDTPAK